MKKIFLTGLVLIVCGILFFTNNATATVSTEVSIPPVDVVNQDRNIVIKIISPKSEGIILGNIELIVSLSREEITSAEIVPIDEPLVLIGKVTLLDGEKSFTIGENKCEIKSECLISLWNTKELLNGKYELTVVDSGNKYSSKPIIVIIENPIVIDEVPTVTNFVIPANSTELTIPITTFDVTDDSETGLFYALTETIEAPTSGWTTTKPTEYIFANAGSKTLYAWAKDAAGHISSSKSANTEITIRRRISSSGSYMPRLVTPTTIEEGRVLGAEKFNFTLPLYFGLQSDEVTELHKRLITDGYLKITSPTGYFGPLTLKAVKEFQLANGLKNDGIVGPLTRAVLNK